MDVASLQVIIKTQGVEAAQRELDKLSKTAGNAEKSVGGLASSMKTLGALASVGAMATLAKEAIKMADVMTTVESRLKLVTKSVEEQTKAQSELFKIAQQTRLGFKETADLYSRIAISTKDYNLSQEKILGITNTINKAMIISGGTAESMNAAIMQLGQAFSSNFQSVGQELASIREQTPALYQAIVDGSGMTSQAFKKAAEDGELSAEIIIKALEKQKEKIDSDFTKISKTVGQSMTLMSNSMLQFVGEVDKSTGASNSLANSITSISLNIDELTQSIKNSNGVLDELSKKANFKIEDDGLLASILKVNQGAGDALYAVLAETLGVVDKTAGEWSKIIDSSYSGMGKWVESVGVSLGVVEERAKATKKAIDSIVPQRPGSDNTTIKLVDDLTDRFSRPDATKKDWELIFDINKKAQDEILNKQKDAQKEAEKLAEEWAKRKIELVTETAIAEQDEMSKPYILLQAQYEADLKEFGSQKGAKEDLERKYQAELQKLNQETVKKFEEGLEKEAKKSAEWQVKMLEANEKYNDEIIKMQDEMYGTDTTVEAWYNNQLEYLGKLSQEAGATAEELQTLLDKIETLKSMKLQKQTISFKVEQSFYSSFENNLADSIENAFNGDSLNLKKFFRNIGNSLINTIASSMSGSIVNSLRGGTLLLGGLSALAVGSYVSASEISTIMNSGGTFDSATNTITTSGGSKIGVGSDGGGTVKSTGSDVMNLVNIVSTLKTAYTVATTGISNSIMAGFTGVSDALAGAGMWGASAGVSNFGYGFANPFSYGVGNGAFGSTMAGGALSAGLLGGAVGYGTGWLGDKLLGANSYAGIGGALGGATGGVLASLGVVGGPLGIIAGSLIGSALGGIFGKKKVTDTGVQFFENMDALDTLSNQTVRAYQDWEKKGWFSKSSGTKLSDLSSSQMKQIEAVFDTYDYLLVQLGDTDKIWLDAGKYSGESFADVLTKNFITAFTDVNQSVDSTIYQAWVDYAKSIDKTVTEALTSSISTFITEKRTFEIWKVGADSIEGLSKKAQFAKEDFSNLENMMGVSGVTVSNFLDMYNQAVKENFTPETIAQWESLGQALMTASDAQMTYTNALRASIDSQYTTVYNSLNSAFILNQQIASIQAEQALISQGISQDNLTALEAQKSGIQTIIDMATKMRDRLISASSVPNLYKSVLESARIDFNKGDYSSDNISRLGEVSGLYAESLQKYALSEADYKLGVLSIANEIEGITGGTTSLTDVENEIKRVTKALKSLEPTLDSQLTALYAQRDTYVEQSEKQIATLEGLLGSSSPLITSFKEALAAARIGQVTAPKPVLPTAKDASLVGGNADISNETIYNYVNSGVTPMDVYNAAIANGVSSAQLAYASGKWTTNDINQWVSDNGLKPFANGGYTGNIGINDIAGVVHGQEYVVNAQTTKDLGLNGSGGAFADMVAELASIRKLMVKLVSDNTKQLSTQRAILGEKVAI